MTKLVPALGLLFLLPACVHSAITTRWPARDNPTSWTFARPVDAVTACLEPGALVADAWGGKTHLELATLIDRHPDGTAALTLESEGYGSDAVRSETFLRHRCPLGIYGRWRVAVAPLTAATTQVQIVASALSLHNYDCLEIGHPWGCALPAKTTTVEEYRMLLSLGTCLGVQDMPAVVHPEGPAPEPATCE
jgi:hypothetical protein